MTAAASSGRSAPAVVPAIAAIGVGKSFLGTIALDDVDVSVAPGEVHGLVGKNGAGKSTLLKILAGAIRPDLGLIAVGGTQYQGLNPVGAQRAGIAVVHQNAELHLDLDVASNLFLGHEPRTRLRLVDDAEMQRAATRLLGRLGLDLPLDRPLVELDVADRQQVAIAKALRADARVLLLDEPTAALNKGQTAFFFQFIRDLAASGIAVVYVSHHLDEVLAIADRVTVLRDGRRVGTVTADTVNKEQLIEMIVGAGASSDPARPSRRRKGPPVLLTLRNVCLSDRLRDVSLDIGKGEIVGLTGRTGAGARALAEVIGGIIRADGDIQLDGLPFAPRSVGEAIARGVVFAPEDMRGQGLVMTMSVAGNLTLARLKKVTRSTWIDIVAERVAALRIGDLLGLTPRDPGREAATLSGGNQRKVLIGRGIFAGAKLLVLQEPTEGVDVEARQQIHAQLQRLAEDGAAIVFLSTDLEELLSLGDRVVILRDGSIAGVHTTAELSPERLLAAIQANDSTDRANNG